MASFSMAWGLQKRFLPTRPIILGGDMEKDTKFLSVQEVSQRVKVPKHTLRFWEKEFGGILSPQRSRGGQRLYSAGDISILKQIRSFRERGFNLSEIRERLQMLPGVGEPREVQAWTPAQDRNMELVQG
jgi:DNA-binding transcriptional MerR regulator